MPDDYGTRYTDAKVRDVGRRLRRIYQSAYQDIQLKTEDFWRRYEAKSQMYLAQVKAGKLSEDDYKAWLAGQKFQGAQWKAKADQIAQTMVDADKIAQRIIDGEKLNIFAANANYIGYSLENGMGIDIGFGLYDSATVARLVKSEPDLLPAIAPEKVEEGKDVRWYQKTITSSVTQGIIQGESIRQIVDRVTSTCRDRAINAATRDVRTAYTGAQNAGRVEGMRQSKQLGINVKKKWMATFDFKTRDTHRELDGQEVDVDEDFVVDGDRIAYPGDRTAEAALVYNCRCTLGWAYPEYKAEVARADNTTGENVGAMTYKQWYAWKTQEAQKDMPQSVLSRVEQANKTIPVVKTIEYSAMFPEEARQITKDTLKKLHAQYPLPFELSYVGDVRTHRGIGLEDDVFDLHYNHPELTPAGAQYLSHGVGGKDWHCIEIHKESYNTSSLQEEFDDRYKIRLKYYDPTQPTPVEHAFYVCSDSLEGTIWHEYAHALSDAYGVFGGNSDNEFRKWQWQFWETHRMELNSISQYAASHPDEMFAEAFVQVQDTRHSNTLAYKLAREIMDAFERYRNGEPL